PTRAICERAYALLQSGRGLETMAPLRLRTQLALYRLGGEAILDAVAAVGSDTRTRRPVVTPFGRAVIATRVAKHLAASYTVGRTRSKRGSGGVRAARGPEAAEAQTRTNGADGAGRRRVSEV